MTMYRHIPRRRLAGILLGAVIPLASTVILCEPPTAKGMYDPKHGRWLQRDPLGYVDGMSLYQYVGGNPVVLIDPSGTNAGGCEDTPPHPGPSAKPKSCCCCCVDDLKIDNYQRIFPKDHLPGLPSAGYMGHVFTTSAKLTHKVHNKKINNDCTFKWEEKTNMPYYPGMAANQWVDMFQLMQGGSFYAWSKRKQPCPGSEFPTDTDPPSVLIKPGTSLKRTLEFRITMKSAQGCPCAHSSKTVTAKQILVVKDGQPVWEKSSFDHHP